MHLHTYFAISLYHTLPDRNETVEKDHKRQDIESKLTTSLSWRQGQVTKLVKVPYLAIISV